MTPPALTHFVEWDARGRRLVKALCGAFIARREHANAPTCPECRRLLAYIDRMRFE